MLTVADEGQGPLPHPNHRTEEDKPEQVIWNRATLLARGLNLKLVYHSSFILKVPVNWYRSERIQHVPFQFNPKTWCNASEDELNSFKNYLEQFSGKYAQNKKVDMVYVLLVLHCIAVIETHEGVKNESFKITKIIGRLTLTA